MSKTGTTTCGFIGLGSQGAPIAQRIIADGFPTVLWARRPETLSPFAGSGAEIATDIADLAKRVDHVGLCVLNDNDVREVFGGLLPELRKGATVAIHSTIHPETARQLAAEASQYGIDVIDAPVSGGEPAAKAGTLTVMLGGNAEAIARVKPVFETFGSLLPHLGDVGAGQNAKLVNNALLAANMAAADYALNAATALRIDKAAMLELLAASSGRSFGLGVRGRMQAPRDFNHGGALLLKDLRLLQAVLGADRSAMGLCEIAGAFLEECTYSAD